MSYSNNIEKRIRKLLSDLAEKEDYYISDPFDQIDIDKDLSSIGINSIAFVKMIVAIESEFGIEIDDEDLDIERISTLRKVIDTVEAACQTRPVFEDN